MTNRWQWCVKPDKPNRKMGDLPPCHRCLWFVWRKKQQKRGGHWRRMVWINTKEVVLLSKPHEDCGNVYPLHRLQRCEKLLKDLKCHKGNGMITKAAIQCFCYPLTPIPSHKSQECYKHELWAFITLSTFSEVHEVCVWASLHTTIVIRIILTVKFLTKIFHIASFCCLNNWWNLFDGVKLICYLLLHDVPERNTPKVCY